MTSIVLPAVSLPVAPKREVSGSLRRFRPRLALGYQDELYRLTHRFETMNHAQVEHELAGALETAYSPPCSV